MKGGGGDAAGTKAVHLVLHQADQRAEHHHGAALDEGGKLVADGLSPAGGEHEQRVPPLERGGDGLLLEGAKIVVPPVLPKEAACPVEVVFKIRGRRWLGHEDLP